jgi:hypothetical protein
VSAVAVAAVTAFITFLATRWKVGKDFEIEINRAVRGDRIEVYRRLWTISEPLAFYAKERDITYADAQRVGFALRRWYYREGGMFLSQNSREQYFGLQKALQTVYKSERAQLAMWKPLESGEFLSVQRRSSNLRTALAEDLGTRRKGLDKASDVSRARRILHVALRR